MAMFFLFPFFLINCNYYTKLCISFFFFLNIHAPPPRGLSSTINLQCKPIFRLLHHPHTVISVKETFKCLVIVEFQCLKLLMGGYDCTFAFELAYVSKINMSYTFGMYTYIDSFVDQSHVVWRWNSLNSYLLLLVACCVHRVLFLEEEQYNRK